MAGQLTVARRRLGSSRFEVSAVALGSWRTFERLPRERGVEILNHARELGINFLDDARYNDETGSAPLSTGYSAEVVFGELAARRAVCAIATAIVLSEKLWWQFWPQQSAAEELAASLSRARLRLDHVDLIYCVTLPAGLSVERPRSPRSRPCWRPATARAWGVANWSAGGRARGRLLAAAAAAGDRRCPCAAQLPLQLLVERRLASRIPGRCSRRCDANGRRARSRRPSSPAAR